MEVEASSCPGSRTRVASLFAPTLAGDQGKLEASPPMREVWWRSKLEAVPGSAREWLQFSHSLSQGTRDSLKLHLQGERSGKGRSLKLSRVPHESGSTFRTHSRRGPGTA